MHDLFRRFATKTSDITGSSWAFILAISVLLIWALSGPIFNFSDTWQLVINTSTSVITFLMVFIIQSSQNRDTKALHLKLNELIRATQEARNTLLNVEDLSEEDLAYQKKEFVKVAQQNSN